MTYTQLEISRITSTRSARQGERYIQDNGYVYVGTYNKTLELISIPDPNVAQESTISSINAKTIKTDTDHTIIVNSVLPNGATKEETQLGILNTLKSQATDSNQEINNLDNYHIISLLTNILKELKEQTKYLTKIYQ